MTGAARPPILNGCTTMAAVLQRRARERPRQGAFSFLTDGERETACWTYGDLDRRARAVAASLQRQGATGERALLLYPPGLEFVAAFFGCLYAGVVAVPAYPPRPGRSQPRLRAVVADARPALALTTGDLEPRLARLSRSLPELASLTWLATDGVEDGEADDWRDPGSGADTLAFLQYTSGSTSAPRGVIVRHGNLLHNQEMIRRAFGQHEGSVVLGWLPLYHDMGLIGNVLQPLYAGGRCILMSPAAFLQRPLRWLSAIDRFRATCSGGPNFAYELCVGKVSPEERQALDLSCWEVAFNGAEPVRAATLERFADVFAPAGFRRRALYPCYGLAEATLFVSGGDRTAPPVAERFDARELEQHRVQTAEAGAGLALVGNGRPWMGQKLLIADPERRVELPPGRVGEIWLAGESVAGGYWGRPEETARTFGARLAQEDGAGEDGADGDGEAYLRTGDLGFVAGGELFVTGRRKDLIIIRGRNLYPQDLEASAEASHGALRPGCGAAFSVDVDGEERLVVVHELRRRHSQAAPADPGEVIAAIRRVVAEEHEVGVHDVVLLAAGAIPKTSSGKIRRHACRARYVDGSLEAVARARGGAVGPEPSFVAPRNPAEERVAAIWSELFALERVSAEADFFALGGDSLTATRLLSRLHEAFGVELALDVLLDAPTVALQAARLESAAAVAAVPLERVDRSGELELSFSQQRLWFLHQLDPDNPVHNIAAAVHVAGRLQVPVLARVFASIRCRHELLRSRFPGAGGRTVQCIDEPAPLPLPVVDLTALALDRRSGLAADLARAGARRPFDLERGPLLRLLLLRLAGEDGQSPEHEPPEHELVVALHHIAADGWSLEVLVDEMRQLYAAFTRGAPSPLPELPVQYADYAAWQRRWLAGGVLEEQLAYWRRRLAGELPAVELPADRPRPAVRSQRGAHLVQPLPAPLAEQLARLAAAAGCTPFMVLLAAFQALLARLTGEVDLVVGTPVAGRPRRQLEGLIGFFVNTLVLRTAAAGDPTFRRLLERAREAAVGAFAHQDLPFERLVDELQPERDLSRSPLFQNLLVLQNAPLTTLRLPGLELRPRELDLGTARFDLALSVARTDQGLEGTWKYSTDLFDATTVRRLARRLTTLLAAALAEPDRRLADLPLLTPAEGHQLLRGFNDTAAPCPQEATLGDLLAVQAAATPEALALVFEDDHLSHGELAGRAGRLARRLNGLGVGRDERVAVSMERSPELLVALHGVVAAGAAYVPLDPAAPAERRTALLEDALAGEASPVLLTGEREASGLPQPSGLQGVEAACLELAPGWGASALGEAPEPPAGAGAALADSLAYVIYTSGSTGRPKGVMVPHRGIVNRLHWMQAAYPLDSSDRVLQKTPYTFDVSVWELFWPFLVGAALVVARPEGHKDAGYLARLIARQRVTTLHFVPSMLQVFLRQEGLAPACRGVRRVIASGEALPAELVERFFRALDAVDGRPRAELHNLYGPTEAAVDVTAWPCSSGDLAGPVPIGRPVANTGIHLLDRRGTPAPLGVPGELHIAGVQLARGYLGRPGRTAGAFVPLPSWGGEPGGRLYRTGDLARRRSDGAVEFLVRLDFQVKVRGVRVELGEIEAALAAHPAVGEAVVRMHPAQGAQGGQLVAYLVADGGELELSELRRFLVERLPEAMIPAFFVPLERFPLTASGKVNRRALPAPAEGHLRVAGSYTAPRDDLERHLAAGWKELLGVERVGVEDNFFELGGDSIQGALFINRLQQELGEMVYVMALFEAPTVAGLAALLRQRYPAAVTRLEGGVATAPEEAAAPPADPESLLALRRFLAEWRPVAAADGAGIDGPTAKAGPVVFILSPFRSGSTLLRVMLAGHPGLFAPPELELLPFATLGQRRRLLDGRRSFSREGLLRAVMELAGCDADGARERMAAFEERDEAVDAFYARLQEWAGDRLLVDKTPSYALQLAVLRRAEERFDGALYIHLTRHPQATIHSYLEARFDQVYAFPWPPRQQAELVWLASHQNILAFLERVPPERRLQVPFEELVQESEAVMRRVSRFLGVGFEPAMLDPYGGGRMTDGLHAESRMMGDPKFHRYRRIESNVAERWRESGGRELGELTRQVARRLGYPVGPEAAVPTAAPDRPLPLSLPQKRLWFLARMEPAATTYNMPAAVRLSGRLALPALARAFSEVVRRHQVLRTRFPFAGGGAVQRISPHRPLTLPVVDLDRLGVGAARELARRSAGAHARRPFDLARGPLLRLALLRLPPAGPDAGEWRLLVNLHHVVADGWSVGVLINEVTALYEAFAAGDPSPLPEPPLQYADWAAEQQRRLAGGALDEQLDFWRRRLAAPLPALDLPSDRPRPARPDHRGAVATARIGAAATAAARELARRQGTTLFVVLLAAYNALLQRLTGEADLLVGTPAANRNRAELEGLIGFFVNTLVVRTRADGDPSFAELVTRTRSRALEAFAHQDVPFEKLVEVLQPERDVSRSPLFQVMFVLQSMPMRPLELPGLTVERLPLDNGAAKFDWNLGVTESGDGLTLELEYSRELFDATTAGRSLGHFHTLLAAAAGSPERSLAELPLLTPAQHHQLLRSWNDTRTAFPAAATLGERLAAQAERTPDALALVEEEAAGDRHLTYRELAGRAGRLARELARRGVGRDDRVAVLMERSVELLVALHGVIVAGAAYVPLDPESPVERLATMLGDALGGMAAPVLLTGPSPPDGGPADGVPPDGGWQRLKLAPGWGASAPGREPPAADPGRALPDSLAYVLYTSGSTGRPKGVMVPHRGIVNRLDWMQAAYRLDPSDRVLQKTPYTFDVSVWELFWPFLTGAALVVARPDGHRDAGYLARLIARRRVTTLHFVPSMLQVFLRQEGLGELCRPLRRVIASGEALPVELVERFFACLGGSGDGSGGAPGSELHNLYGPTEASVDVTAWPCAGGASGRPVPIGRAVANTTLHLLDRRGELVPLGVPGELHIGGVQLARGYLGRPGRTAGAFVPSPGWDGSPGGRLYRTGDLARRRADGAVEFLGRLDFQVKVRGVRIELGEVEAALLAHPQVRETVVVAEAAGGGRLVAYLVAEGGGIEVSELRRFLTRSLTAAAVPALFVLLEALPLSPNGKVDRRALPAPEGRRPELEAAYTAPRSAAERTVAETWQQVLGVDRVGLHDNFFDLGGHSLLLADVHARLSETFAREIPMVELFQHTTVHALARHLEQEGGASAETARRAEIQADVERQKQARRRRRRRLKESVHHG